MIQRKRRPPQGAGIEEKEDFLFLRMQQHSIRSVLPHKMTEDTDQNRLETFKTVSGGSEAK